MKPAVAAVLAAIGLCAAPALGQETRGYSYGVGRIAWTFPEGLAA